MPLTLQLEVPNGPVYRLTPGTDVGALREHLSHLGESRCFSVEVQSFGEGDPRITSTIYLNAEALASAQLWDVNEDIHQDFMARLEETQADA